MSWPVAATTSSRDGGNAVSAPSVGYLGRALAGAGPRAILRIQCNVLARDHDEQGPQEYKPRSKSCWSQEVAVEESGAPEDVREAGARRAIDGVVR